MVSKLLSLASFALAASQVYAAPLARRDVYEATLEWPNLEDYSVFQARYEQLHCATHRGAVREDADQFYWDCCHPITRDQTIDVLPESCGLKPSAAAVAPSSTVEATTSTPAPVVESPTVAPEVLPAVTSPAAEAPAPTPTPTPEAPAETPATPAPSPVTPPATGGQAGTATFYFQNGVAGACGDVHPDSDPIIALPIGQWGTGSYGEKSPLCGRQMTITNTQNGQSVVATVADGCPTCAPEQIDLSTGAFDALGSRDQGVLQVNYALI